MINKKEILWSILAKYDGVSEFNSFCDSISRFIQDKQNGDDIIKVFQGLSSIDKIDENEVNKAIKRV